MKPKGKLCLRIKESDESSTLLLLKRMALGMHAKEILLYISLRSVDNQLCHLHRMLCSPLTRAIGQIFILSFCS